MNSPEELEQVARELSRTYQGQLKKSRDIQKVSRRLKMLERMQGMFLDLVSHELRTPLTLIRGYVHMLERALDRPDQRAALADCTRALASASARLERLVDQLLAFSEVRGGPGGLLLRELHLGEEVHRVAGELSGLARQRRVDLKVSVQGDPPALNADPDRVREALMHLVKNAILYSRDGGGVEVEVREAPEGCQVEIRDDGIGIPPEEVERVFAPFYQVAEVTTRGGDGLGLGLAIARSVVHGHGGRIDLESELGRGTTVRVFLPRQVPVQRSELPPLPASGEAELLEYARRVYQNFETERGRSRHLEDTYRALERTYLESVGHLVGMLEPAPAEAMAARSRAARLAVWLARKVQPELLEQRDFLYSLLLLELGRIGVAQPLLQRAGAYLGSEIQMVVSHSEQVRGGTLPDLRSALVALRHLHERWDGKGHPEHLKGEEIPPVSRILALADALDQLLEAGRLRPELDLESARAHVERQSGRWFEPRLVEALGEIWTDLE
ncbi:MAG: ATP-binding protein [Candidatus Eremiobacterota bacterium]